MPLYLDLHQLDNISVDALKRDHLADKAVQDKYNVRIIQFWVNEKTGDVYCLIEGPNAKACSDVHKEAHGNIACNIQEVEPGFFKILSKRDEKFLDDFFGILEEDLQLPTFNVSHLSEMIGMSRPQLYRKINALTGKSPNEFIKYVRMNKALSLLKSRKSNISEIAMEVGYTNPSYFTKVFNEYFGYTPSAYYTNYPKA